MSNSWLYCENCDYFLALLDILHDPTTSWLANENTNDVLIIQNKCSLFSSVMTQAMLLSSATTSFISVGTAAEHDSSFVFVYN